MIKEIGEILSQVISPVTKMVDQLTTTDEEKLKLKNKLEEIKNNFIIEVSKQKADIIKSEINSESWLTRNWRPILMITFVFIIANNYILFPYMQLFFHTGVKLEIPPDMWQILKIGLGGYIVGRSAEKIFKKGQ